MKIGKLHGGGKEFTGIINEEKGIVEEVDDPFSRTKTGRVYPFGEFKFLPPITPTKIIGVGLNYADHARELGMELPSEPLIFLKPPSAIIGNMDAIVHPRSSKRVEYEGELAVVIGKKCRNVPKTHAHEVILGYTIFNDVTARDLQEKDELWTRSKGFDTFAPIGPWIITPNEVNDASSLNIRTLLNGDIRQDSNTSKLIFGVRDLVAFISDIMTLNPGDVIATGTPPGVGPIRPGDVVSIEIEGIGKLSNPVVKSRG
jgi:4-hydroxyphenylacetate degradation bifunctional isomerase/decarboxylase decarboxylase subunit